MMLMSFPRRRESSSFVCHPVVSHGMTLRINQNMNETIIVKIITPLSIAFEKQAKMVTLPGDDGMFGVLPSHTPMLVSLKTGLVQVYIDDMHKPKNTYLISGGVTEVAGSYINIATEIAINVTNLSEAEIATKLLDL